MLLTVTLAAILHAAPAADTIPGSWHFTGDISGFPLDQVCTFAQSGATITGSCSAEGGVEIPVFGEMTQDTLVFEHESEYEGEPLTVIYTGTLSSSTELKGSIYVEPFAVSGYFTARPVDSPDEGAPE